MIRVTTAIFLFLFGCAIPAQLLAATLYVDGTNGNDASTGLTPAAAWRTIQRAADAVNPGDTVLIEPGVYFEHVILTRAGTVAQPITFRAAAPGVIVSGANPTIRAGQNQWTLENQELNLYSTPLGYEPTTVLSDGVDLYAYERFSGLQTFTLTNVNNVAASRPGPQQGFAFDSGKLYVRLNARYGSLDPAAHVIKVSPPRAGGTRGDVIQSVTDYNWSIQTTVPAYAILDGFTFESPGFTGVWIQFGNVTVRNCTFLGCRTGVRGWDTAETQPPADRVTADVIVQGCEFSQYPAWQDTIDVIAVAEALSPAEQAALPVFFWWSRKGGPRTSEIGLTAATGLRWKILGNYVHDTLDGLSYFALSWSEQCEVAYNRFEKLIDNAVESENHAQHLRVHHNYVRDVYEPFSYQPNNDVPYPASIWFYRNIVTCTPEATTLFGKSILKWIPGCFKIKPPGSGFTAIGLDGLLCFNNTIHFPLGNVLTVNSTATTVPAILFRNNIVIATDLQTEVVGATFAGTDFAHNVVAPSAAGLPGPGGVFAGAAGLSLGSATQIGFEDFAAGRFALAAGSPSIAVGAALPGVVDSSGAAGALSVSNVFSRFDEWRFHYFYDHLFEPAISGAAADPDGDGLCNAMECLLDRNPLRVDSQGAITSAVDASSRIVLSFTRRTVLPADLNWFVEASPDLGSWASGPTVTETLTPVPASAGRQTERVRDLTAIGAVPRRFLRLGVTLLDRSSDPVPINDPAPPTTPSELLIDSFDDGGLRNGLDALDAAWFTIFPPSNGTAPTMSVVNDSAGLGSGYALFIDNVTPIPPQTPQTGSKSIVASFPRATLANTGDQLIIGFQVRFARIAADHAQNYFRFGPYDSHNLPYTSDNQYRSPGHNGYLASLNFGAIAGVPALIEESGTAGNINSDGDLAVVGSFGPDPLSLLTSVSRYTATLTFTKTSTAMTCRLRLLNTAGNVLLDQTVTDATPLTTFNEMVFSTSQSEADYLLDNVTINFVPAAP